MIHSPCLYACRLFGGLRHKNLLLADADLMRQHLPRAGIYTRRQIHLGPLYGRHVMSVSSTLRSPSSFNPRRSSFFDPAMRLQCFCHTAIRVCPADRESEQILRHEPPDLLQIHQHWLLPVQQAHLDCPRPLWIASIAVRFHNQFSPSACSPLYMKLIGTFSDKFKGAQSLLPRVVHAPRAALLCSRHPAIVSCCTSLICSAARPGLPPASRCGQIFRRRSAARHCCSAGSDL